jgi:hypothetical protein
MATDTAKEISSVENMTKQEMAKIIKTAKRRYERQKQESTTSVCDIMKDNTSELIQKIGSDFARRTELYTALYSKYLNTADNICGACYMSEKKFFSNIGPDKALTHAFGAYWKLVTDMATAHIDMATSFLQTYVQMRIDTIGSYDKIACLMIDSYTQVWNQFKTKAS